MVAKPSRAASSGRIEDANALLRSKGVFDPSTVEGGADTSSTIAYFMQAAKQQDYYSSTGLALYKSSMETAKSEIVNNYQQAIATLRPQEQASRAALDEMMRFVGIDPAQATSGMTDSLSGIPGVEGSKLNDLIRQAEQERDPTRRAELKAQIETEFDNAQQLAQQARTDSINKQQSSLVSPTNMGNVGPAPRWEQFSPKGMSLAAANGGDGGAAGHAAVAAYQKAMDQYNNKVQQNQQLYNSQLSSIDRQKQDIANQTPDYTNQLNDLKSQFLTSYKDEYDGAYTGDQVIDKLEKTPGYQFQMDQGTKAIERQGAAKGMLGSGNTLLSLQQYGQDLAQGYYQQHLGNLQNIAQQGSGAATSIANLFAQKGTLLSGISQAVGEKSSDIYNLIGQGYAAAYNRAGEVEFKSAEQTAANKFAAQESAKARAADIAGKIINNEPAHRSLDQSAGAAAGAAAAAAEEKEDLEKEMQGFKDRLKEATASGTTPAEAQQYAQAGTTIPGAKPMAGSAASQAAQSAKSGGGNASV